MTGGVGNFNFDLWFISGQDTKDNRHSLYVLPKAGGQASGKVLWNGQSWTTEWDSDTQSTYQDYKDVHYEEGRGFILGSFLAKPIKIDLDSTSFNINQNVYQNGNKSFYAGGSEDYNTVSALNAFEAGTSWNGETTSFWERHLNVNMQGEITRDSYDTDIYWDLDASTYASKVDYIMSLYQGIYSFGEWYTRGRQYSKSENTVNVTFG